MKNDRLFVLMKLLKIELPVLLFLLVNPETYALKFIDAYVYIYPYPNTCVGRIYSFK